MEGEGQPPFRFDLGGRALVLACHQGRLVGHEPPNDLASIAACVAAGAARVEVDVTFTSDAVPVLSHDEEFLLDGQRQPATAVPSAAIPSVPRLTEVVDLLNGSGAVLQIDLKRRGPAEPAELEALTATLAPLRPNVIVGSQAHWNLRPLAAAGFAVGFDPTVHFRYVPAGSPRWWRSGPPRGAGHWGFRDDAPYAADSGWSFARYLSTRLDDLLALVPGVAELMVDIGTVLRVAELGVALGDALAERGVALAGWTVRRFEGPKTVALVEKLVSLGTATVITDVPVPLGRALLDEGQGSPRRGHVGDTVSPPPVPGAPPSERRR